MSNKIKIISDGSCDLNNDTIEKNNLIVLPFYVSFKEDESLKENVDISVRNFYNRMVENENVFPKSSMPSVNDYLDVFLELAKNNYDIIVICICKNFSGSYNSAILAKDILLEEYPNTKITIIDSQTITVLQGLLVKETCKMLNDNLNYEEIIENLDRIKNSGRIFFTVKNLDYLKHGGRIGKITAIIGNVLKINPIITFANAEISSGGVSISRKRALLKIIDMITSHLKNEKASIEDYNIVVGYGYDIEEGKDFFQKISNTFSNIKVFFEQIGATISVHTGPHALGIGMLRKYK